MLGVNYWPAAQAMDWLRVYDPAITRRDFARAREAGFDTIRVFLRWEDAQPTADTFDAAVLRRLVDAADAAVEAGVRLLVTLFTGHMSGVNWIPVVGGRRGVRRSPLSHRQRRRRRRRPRPASATGTATPRSSTRRSGWRPRPPTCSPAIPASGAGTSATRTRTARSRRTRRPPKRGSNG